MSDQISFDWFGSAPPGPTGRVLGAYKSAAFKTGCSVDTWLANRLRGEAWCFGCRTWKGAAAFVADNSRPSGLSGRCKPCMSEASTASRYGMSIAGLREFRAHHQYRCGICGAGGMTVVDHNHVTGKVRGLLCTSCNSAIGQLKEDPALFAAALAYLEKHRG